MSDWQPVLLGDIARIEIGGTPARDQARFWAESNEGHPWVSIADMTEKWISRTAETITDIGVKHSNTKMIPKGTLMMSFKLSIGRCGIAARTLYSNEAIASFFLDRTRASTPWLYYALPPVAARAVVDVAIKGATLNMASLRRLPLVLPPLAEQELIAQVIDCVDESVARTEAAFAKLKLVKQGLLQDLLTRGIDDNGELRDPDRHPEQFKDTPLGRIPASWKLAQIHALGEIVTGRTPPSHDPTAWGDALPFVTPADVSGGASEIQISERYLSSTGVRYVRVLPARTVLVVCIGSTLGKVGVSTFSCSTNQQINALICEQSLSIPEFVGQSIQFHICQLHRWAGLQAVPIVNKSQFGKLQVPLPPLAEQELIAKKLLAIDARMQTERASVGKFRLLKQALADDLLTGRVRVTPLLKGSI